MVLPQVQAAQVDNCVQGRKEMPLPWPLSWNRENHPQEPH